MPPGSSVERRLEWVAFTHEAARAGLGASLVITEYDVLAGAIDMRLIDREDPRIGELGYLLAPGFRGRGILARALRLLVSWSFGEPLRLERVQALVHPSNDRSAAVLTRAGFVREGVLRAYRAEPGGREDREIWSLLPIDWRPS